MTDAFASNLVHFVRYLRARGLTVVPATARDLASAIQVVGLDRRDDVYHALRALSIVRPTEREAFDDAFELFFGAGRTSREIADVIEAPAKDAKPGQQTRAAAPLLVRADREDRDATEDVSEVVGGSYAERLAHRDFRDLSVDEREEIRRLISKMRWDPADAASRRWMASRSGMRPDLRRTFRAAVRPEGDLLPMAMVSRRMRKRPLVVIADISGSMERYTELFLHFIHAAQGRLGRVESFAFATRLSRITREMRLRVPEDALVRISGTVTDWAGGTRIGEALEVFNRDWSRRVTRGGAIGLIISDGWDTGDPDLLGREMHRFARAMHRVMWLNPLASRPGFAPETRGLRIALPYVDDFLPAGRLVDLRSVVRLLESVSRRPGAVSGRLRPPAPVRS